ncbi:low temperature requirement protein A [Nocardioides sp. Kera G14]|uniref:low temperature requirement protein A n=1 Tax=Nocardioides sp. Kera G14 TaxID=2884264 RepID=UPI001D11CBC1|nr:low temperature requirement protein A [Nocardioides sp. Kera G14]UDY24786.1 low temperature requirement protein A [Nocardioides sp. Kera G14]
MADATLQHRAVRMVGRDPGEPHRSATPLELLFDLTFVVAFGTAADALAHGLAERHTGVAIGGFCFATFGVAWAWINFTWFASAYDTDDWIYRLTTMLQMAGVLLFALGLPAMFASLTEHAATLNNDVMVIGYVVMRVAMVLQWLRATRHDPSRRGAHGCYIVSIVVAQVLWCLLAFANLSIPLTFALMVVPMVIELGGPAVAERRFDGTPWHPHHIAERYGLMVIIALGEGLIGTMASLVALSGDGLTFDVGLLAFVGTALIFGLWWTYYAIPHGEILAAWRERSFGWGYGHILIFGSIVAMGAGLHVAAYFLEHESATSLTTTVAAVAVPTAIYLLFLYVLYAVFTRTIDPFHLILIGGSAVTIVLSLVLAASGIELAWSLAVLAVTPWITVLGYETVGYRHNAEVLEGSA